jgi:DMSO reductase anchor subunit
MEVTMSKAAASGGGGHHELPLILFTALGVAGGGIGAAGLLRATLSWSLPLLTRTESLVLTALLGIGFLISAGHLGKPLRGLLALRGIGRSALSNEIVALGVTLAGGVLGAVLAPTHPLQWVFDLLACAGSVAFLLAVGAVYVLPGQLAWRGPVFLQPLVLGITWGLLLGGADPVGLGAGTVLRTLWVALLLDGVLVLLRTAAVERAGKVGASAHPHAFRLRGVVMGIRLALSALATPLALLSDQWGLALCALSLACLLDRFAFYALAVRETTDSEVARVEAML